MRSIFTASAALAALTLATPALADNHSEGAMAMEARSLSAVLTDAKRSEEAVRDQYRNPAETLAFFQVEPNMNVVEYGPGGGWYSKVLAPYIAPSGQYMAMNGDSDGREYRDRAQQAASMGWSESFPERVQEWTGVPATMVTAFESDEIPEDVAGQVDRVLVFRSLHGMRNSSTADREIKAMRDLLKDGGMVGVVQHRAPEDASYDMSKGTRGYLKQSDVIKMFELQGFELADTSEINANPRDDANWEGGVWTLPPVLRYGDQDRAKYEAIGESDRMTLLFRKVG
ncbi:MAG: hypothetical protein WA908_02485 [Pontixanthobacter sp.]